MGTWQQRTPAAGAEFLVVWARLGDIVVQPRVAAARVLGGVRERALLPVVLAVRRAPLHLRSRAIEGENEQQLAHDQDSTIGRVTPIPETACPAACEAPAHARLPQIQTHVRVAADRAMTQSQVRGGRTLYEYMRKWSVQKGSAFMTLMAATSP